MLESPTNFLIKNWNILLYTSKANIRFRWNKSRNLHVKIKLNLLLVSFQQIFSIQQNNEKLTLWLIQVAAMQAEVSMMQSQLMNSRYAYASTLQTTHQQQHQILQQPTFNVSVQPAYSNNSSASTNNLVNMNNFNHGFDLTMETAPSSQSLEPFHNSRLSHYEDDD